MNPSGALQSPWQPWRNILRLSVGDLLAKTLYFMAFVSLARRLGAAHYGVLEFALSVLTYFLLLADAGIEMWATREVAQQKDVRVLAACVMPLRLGLATVACGILLLLLPAFPDYPGLRTILLLLGLTLFAQAVNVKWVFLGQENMTRVAAGLIVGQTVFALAVFVCIRNPAHLVWVPILRLVSDLMMAGYFGRLFMVIHGRFRLAFTLRGTAQILRQAYALGVSQALGLVNYNFDAVLLGFFLGPTAVGWYTAAYKPVTVVLALALTYFQGLFPLLSRTYTESPQLFHDTVLRSLRLASLVAMPLGVGGTLLAEPIIGFLFGHAYVHAAPTLQVLSWAAGLVILRGTYRQAFNAARMLHLDLRCAGVAAALNIVLNLLLIPSYGLIGAACATLIAEAVWLMMAVYYFSHNVLPVRLLPLLRQPAVAAVTLGVALTLAQPLFWLMRAAIGVLTYCGVLLLLEEIIGPPPYHCVKNNSLKA